MDTKLVFYSRELNKIVHKRNYMFCTHVWMMAFQGRFRYKVLRIIIDCVFITIGDKWNHCKKCYIFESMIGKIH